jgi:hypothetical protein
MKLLLTIAALGLLQACTRKNETWNSVSLPIQQCVSISNGNRICFDSVITDSRCPANANCVWQGYAAAQFTLRTAQGNFPFALATTEHPSIDYSQDTVISGIRIRFTDLRPYPGTGTEPVRAVLDVQ